MPLHSSATCYRCGLEISMEHTSKTNLIKFLRSKKWSYTRDKEVYCNKCKKLRFE